MNKKPSFFRQAAVLTKRYFHIYINNKQSLILAVGVPLLTIIIVCLVACSGMFAVVPTDENEINDGLPVLNWEYVTQYEENDDTGDIEAMEHDESEVDKWNGDDSFTPPTVPTKIGDEDFFMITEAEELVFLSQAVNNGYEEYLTYNYILQKDIDLKGHDWTPIGNADHPFTGTFDGNGHIIKNLKIKSDDNNVGLFGCLESDETEDSEIELNDTELVFYHNGIIKNLQLDNAKLNTKGNNVGALVGSMKGASQVTSVSVKDGEIKSEGKNIGGIVGKASDKDANIYICYSTIEIEAEGENVGGIVGNLDDAKLSAAYYAVGDIKFDGDNDDAEGYGAIAGVCEDMEDQLLNCYYEYDKDEEDDEDAFVGVDGESQKGYVEGVKASQLTRLASFLTPFEGIETAYDIENPEEDDDKDKDDDDDEDEDEKKEDEDEDTIYGFKQDGQIPVFGDTQTGLFMLVCVAIFVGICNAIQEICKERNILKREYMTNLNLTSYVFSKLVVQGCIVAIQMLVVLVIFAVAVSDKLIPEKGVFMSFWGEYYITLFLLAFAADTMALVISSIVKNGAMANMCVPIILIVQIVFSGVLFKTEGFMDVAANAMISKWGIAGLAASTGLNNSQTSFIIENPALQMQFGSAMSTVKDAYAATTSNLLMIWGVLLGVCVICTVLCRVILMGVKKDKR